MIEVVVAAALVPAVVPFTTVASGDLSGIEEPREVVVRAAAEWGALWREHGEAGALPAIDFTTSMVLGVFLGSRASAGFHVEITSVRLDNGVLVVEYRERTPPPGMVVAQVLTAPFHLVRVARRDQVVRFKKVGRTEPPP